MSSMTVTKKSTSMSLASKRSGDALRPESTMSFDKYAVEPQLLDFDVKYLGPEHIKEIEKCNGFVEADAKRHYDHVAANYDAIYDRIGYPDPVKVAEKCAKHA